MANYVCMYVINNSQYNREKGFMGRRVPTIAKSFATQFLGILKTL